MAAQPLLSFLRNATGILTMRVGRDPRIDFVRGLALLIIFLDHLPGNPVARYTLHAFGFTDAADLFVLLAGISAALAYGPVFRDRGMGLGSLKVGARIWEIYIAHIVLFVMVAGIVAWAATTFHNPLYLETINIFPLFENAQVALASALLLAYQPGYLDILPMYVVLLMMFPMILSLVRVSPALALAASFGLWLCANLIGWNLPNNPGAGNWFFNPFAWQLLFTLGIVLGCAATAGLTLPRDRLSLTVAFAVLAVCFLLRSPWSDMWSIGFLPEMPEALRPEISKSNASLWRVTNVLALVYVFWALVPAGLRWFEGAVARAVCNAGRHSLEVYCLGTVLAITGHILVVETASTPTSYYAVSLLGCALLLGLGSFLTWYKSIGKESAKVAAPAAYVAPKPASA